MQRQAGGATAVGAAATGSTAVGCGGVGAVIVHVPPGADTSTPRRPGRGMTNTPQAGAVRGLLTDQQARVALGCCAIEWSQSGQNELTAKVGAATYLIAREWLLPSTPKWSVHLSHPGLGQDTLLYRGYALTPEGAKELAQAIANAPLKPGAGVTPPTGRKESTDERRVRSPANPSPAQRAARRAAASPPVSARLARRARRSAGWLRPAGFTHQQSS